MVFFCQSTMHGSNRIWDITLISNKIQLDDTHAFHKYVDKLINSIVGVYITTIIIRIKDSLLKVGWPSPNIPNIRSFFTPAHITNRHFTNLHVPVTSRCSCCSQPSVVETGWCGKTGRREGLGTSVGYVFFFHMFVGGVPQFWNTANRS